MQVAAEAHTFAREGSTMKRFDESDVPRLVGPLFFAKIDRGRYLPAIKGNMRADELKARLDRPARKPPVAGVMWRDGPTLNPS